MQQGIPPHSAESEQEFLSACLVGAAREGTRLVRPSDMYKTAHQVILKTIVNIERAGNPIELISVVNELRSQKQLEDVGGASYIAFLHNDTPAASSLEYHAKVIKEKSVKRRLIEKCNNLMQSCMADEPLPQLIDKAKAVQVVDKSNLINRQRMVDMSNVYTAERMLESYTKHISSLKNNRFITGVSEIDKRIRGVAGGETLFIIARAGAYKTGFLQNMLRNYINNSAWGAVMYEIEMPVAGVTERYLQMFDRSNGRHIEDLYSQNDPSLTNHLNIRFKNELNKFFIIPTKVGLSEIEQYINLIQEETKVKIGVIGIDYMGLVDEPGKEYEAISRVARGCKDLAKSLNIPVIALSQLNRKGEAGNTEVTLDMGRGSGAIEEAADFVLGLWKPQEGLVAKILKNRKGRVGSKWLLDLDQTCFYIGPKATKYVPPKKTDCDGF